MSDYKLVDSNKPICLTDFFSKVFTSCRNKYKKTQHTAEIKYDAKTICDVLYRFVNNSVYFSRYDHDIIDGKYLNRIHLTNIKMGVYDELFNKIQEIYIQENPDGLKNLSI